MSSELKELGVLQQPRRMRTPVPPVLTRTHGLVSRAVHCCFYPRLSASLPMTCLILTSGCFLPQPQITSFPDGHPAVPSSDLVFFLTSYRVPRSSPGMMSVPTVQLQPLPLSSSLTHTDVSPVAPTNPRLTPETIRLLTPSLLPGSAPTRRSQQPVRQLNRCRIS